jgi:hypothetical protein
MSLATVRNKIDNWLTPRWANLVNKQETYKANHGHYFQGLWTHHNEIEQTDLLDGDVPPDRIEDSPTDTPHNWRELIQNAFDALPFPARLRIDVYEAPTGVGWFAVLHVRYQGTIYARAKGVGPEAAQYTYNWAAI